MNATDSEFDGKVGSPATAAATSAGICTVMVLLGAAKPETVMVKIRFVESAAMVASLVPPAVPPITISPAVRPVTGALQVAIQVAMVPEIVPPAITTVGAERLTVVLTDASSDLSSIISVSR